jgi:hypothetical protein
MLKSLCIPLALLLLSGCATVEPKVKHTQKPAKTMPNAAPVKHKQTTAKSRTKPVEVKHVTKQYKMFQTVAKKDAVLLQKGKNKVHCAVCGMNLVMFYKTNHAATDMNGTMKQYCSLHCLSDDLRHGVELENPKVVDITSLQFIPVQEAYYVVGSKKPATMSRVSKYAFKSLDDAKKFQKKYGGKIVDFYSAWQIAKKDFK